MDGIRPASERQSTRAGLRPLLLPAAIAAALAAFLLHPAVRNTPGAFWTFVAAVLGILAWTGWLFAARRGRDESLTLEFVLRTPHWMQTLAQGALLVWWGLFVDMVPLWAPMILAQLLLAVAVESLFAWTRRGRYTAGLGVIPVIFSVNLFLWFTGPWFFFQFAMVVLVYAGKEFIRWQLDGRSRHIFNPSALALSVASVALIATGSTEITLGIEIAQSQFIPPQMFLVIFLAAVPAQLIFGVAMMTVPAVLTIMGFGLLYHSLTGIYFFYDAFIPVSVFLGLHLLFTDPATSPRSDGGRILFGLIYGTGVITSAAMLDAIGAPNFYDKLLPVPILNLLAPRLDRAANALGRWASFARREAANPRRRPAAGRDGGDLGHGVRDHELRRPDRRQPSRPVLPVLARCLRDRQRTGVQLLRRDAAELLRPRLRLGVQRVRRPARAAGPQFRRGGRRVRAGMPAGVRGGLPESADAGRRRRAIGAGPGGV